MLKMKLAVVVTALLTMLGFTSCLNGDGNSTGYGTEYVKVDGFMGFYSFKSAAGYTINPLNGSQITSDIGTTYALINYQYDSETVTPDAKEIDVTLTGILPISTKNVSSNVAGMEEYSNAPIRMVSVQSYEYYSIAFWDKYTMFLPIYYFAKQISDEDEQKEELNSHSFELYYDANDENAATGELLLHLRHNVKDPDINKERTTLTSNIFHYDLNSVLAQYAAANGGDTPSKITVEYEQNSYNSEYESGVMSTKVEIDYAAIVAAYDKK